MNTSVFVSHSPNQVSQKRRSEQKSKVLLWRIFCQSKLHRWEQSSFSLSLSVSQTLSLSVSIDLSPLQKDLKNLVGNEYPSTQITFVKYFYERVEDRKWVKYEQLSVYEGIYRIVSNWQKNTRDFKIKSVLKRNPDLSTYFTKVTSSREQKLTRFYLNIHSS